MRAVQEAGQKHLRAAGWRADEAGLTLLETVLAILILGLVAIPFMNMFYTGTRAYSDAAGDTVTLNLAQGLMEEYVDMDYDALASVPETGYPGFDGYTYQVTVTDYDDGDAQTTIKQVTVRVEGSDPGRAVELTTLRAGR